MRPKISLSVLFAVILFCPGALFGQFTWTKNSSGIWNWSDAANWSGGLVPGNPATAEVIFPSASSTNFATLQVNLDTAADQVLQGGLTFQFQTNFRVNPKLNLEGKKMVLDGGSLRVAANSATVGNVVTFSNGTVQLGTANNAAALELGASLPSGGSGDGNTMLFESGAVLDTVNTSSINVASGNVNNLQNFTLDLSGAGLKSGSANKTLAVTSSIGAGVFSGPSSSNGRNKSGLIKMGDVATLTIGQDLILGQNLKANGTTAKVTGELQFLAGATEPLTVQIGRDLRVGVGDDATGTVTNAPVVMNLTVGSAATPSASRGVIYLGYNDKNQALGNDGVTVGTLDAGNGTLSAYVRELRIGENVSTNGSASGRLNAGSLILSNLDVSGDAVIGKGNNAAGELSLKGGLASSLNLTVGSATGSQRSVLTLNGTQWSVGNNLVVGSLGTINILVDGQAAGLDLSGTSDVQFMIIAGGVIAIDFSSAAAEVDLWGVRMLGDHQTLFQSYLADGRLSGSGSYGTGASIFFDGAYTYYGLAAVPEPSVTILIAFGITFMVLWKGRTLKKERVSAC